MITFGGGRIFQNEKYMSTDTLTYHTPLTKAVCVGINYRMKNAKHTPGSHMYAQSHDIGDDTLAARGMAVVRSAHREFLFGPRPDSE